MSSSQENSLESLFFSEAASRLQLLLEKFADFRTTGREKDSIAHILHTLKGSAGMVGFKEEAQLIHDLEEMFQTLHHDDQAEVFRAEKALKQIVERLTLASSAIESQEQREATTPAPFFLAQRLLASVSRFESLLDSWTITNRAGRTSKSQKIRAELSFDTELKELRKHSFGLAFGHPDDLFFGLQELVQLVARSEGKLIELHCSTEEIYVLREYIPELRSALVHLVSNCVVHGIEGPEERVSLGKRPEGQIDITMEQSGDKLCLVVCDDGSGVDLAALEMKYRAGNFDVDWSDLSEEQRLNLLFEKGTSLKDGANLHAGRGVGLSSVRETVRRLGGEVAFEVRELGSCVSLKVPSPFFVADCLMVESEGRSFGVLSSSVESVEELGERELPTLSSCLGFAPESLCLPRFALWLSEAAAKKAGVAVDSCIGLKEVVVYPNPELKGLSSAVLGLADLGQSRQMVVDLMKLSLLPRVSSPKPVKLARRGPRVLVVDDSATTRSILLEVLRRDGFSVVEAEDGMQALELMESQGFEVIVSDLEMPRMNGLQLLEKLREPSSPYATLPFVLFTSRDDTQSFQKALLLGADRCIGKAAFDETEFLSLLKELVREN